MSGWVWMTWASIAVLVLGSLAVFVWFLFDIGRLFGTPEVPPTGPVEAAPPGDEAGS